MAGGGGTGGRPGDGRRRVRSPRQVSYDATVAGPDTSAHRPPRPLRLEPFRGLRFDPDRVGDIGTVVSPPYDVLDADTVRRLEEANRRNIVRLILSRRFERPYEAVRQRLVDWRDAGYLRPDPEPALYVYEFTIGEATVRGLVGLLGLRDDDEGVVLPHEDVMPGPVADRAALMRATCSNLEPILLVHRGTGNLRTLTRALTARPPLLDAVALDGSRHRLWAATDEGLVARLQSAMAGGEALIADGHHRWAAYQRLQASEREAEAPDGQSPWDFGLAMLVDDQDGGLAIGPIHRTVAGLTLADLHDLAGGGTTVVAHPDREAAAAAWRSVTDDDPTRTAFPVSDGRSWALVGVPRPHGSIDAAVLHELVLPSWGVSEEQVGYHHSLDQALAAISRQPGLAVAVRPPSLAEVMDAAAAGVRMPRKSTSFSPKPRMGVVMRDLTDA